MPIGRKGRPRPRAVTMRVLDQDGREVHSEIKGGSAAGKAFTNREKHW